MRELKTKYSDDNLFFKGTKSVYDAKEYIGKDTRRRSAAKTEGPKSHDYFGTKKQFLSREDEEACLLIKNRDLMDPAIKKVDSDSYQVGRFLN